MMEKIVRMRQSLTVKDIIDVQNLISQQSFLSRAKRRELLSNIHSHSKPFIVEEIDSLTFRDLLSLVMMFQSDMEFKRFLAHNLKEKML